MLQFYILSTLIAWIIFLISLELDRDTLNRVYYSFQSPSLKNRYVILAILYLIPIINIIFAFIDVYTSILLNQLSRYDEYTCLRLLRLIGFSGKEKWTTNWSCTEPIKPSEGVYDSHDEDTFGNDVYDFEDYRLLFVISKAYPNRCKKFKVIDSDSGFGMYINTPDGLYCAIEIPSLFWNRMDCEEIAQIYLQDIKGKPYDDLLDSLNCRNVGNFQSGSPVRLKNGGDTMVTIGSFFAPFDGEVHTVCSWIDIYGNIHDEVYLDSALEIVKNNDIA